MLHRASRQAPPSSGISIGGIARHGPSSWRTGGRARPSTDRDGHGGRIALLSRSTIRPNLKRGARQGGNCADESALLSPRHVLPGRRRNRIREMSSYRKPVIAGGVAFVRPHVAVRLGNDQGRSPAKQNLVIYS
jgi:hypothetical protein